MYMTSQTKYYSPSIEEFHVGFRYQGYFKSILKGEVVEPQWEDRVFKSGHKIYAGNDILIPENCRVKYLDQQDIEELGWVYRGAHWFYKRDSYYEIIEDEHTNYFLHIHGDESKRPYSIILGSPNNGYSLEGSDHLFNGEIKNFNELERLMKQLKIKE